MREYSVDEDEMDRLETYLDVSTIIEIREAIKLKVRQTKTKQSGWFGGWFSSSESTDDAYSMTSEDRERLHVS